MKTKKMVIDILKSKGFKVNYKNVICAGYLLNERNYVFVIQNGELIKVEL